MDRWGHKSTFFTSQVQEREDSPEPEQPEASTSLLVPAKRKHPTSLVGSSSIPLEDSRDIDTTEAEHSPSLDATGESDQIIDQDNDDPTAPPPFLVPYSNNRLPPSEFEFYSTRSHPINKHNYRYIPCGPAPLSLETRAALPDAPTLVPLILHRTAPQYPTGVRFSWEDRSPFVLITPDARTITAEKGWRGARGNVGVREGAWYWEVKVERGGGEGGREQGGSGEGSWVRVGVGRRESPINAPVGIDGHSYAYRDRSGDAVTLARPKPYGAPFTTSSTIGIYVSLPPRAPPSNLHTTAPLPFPDTFITSSATIAAPSPSASADDPVFDRADPSRVLRKRVPIRYKNRLFFESLEYAATSEMKALVDDPADRPSIAFPEVKAAPPGKKARAKAAPSGPEPRELPILEGSKIAFFLDGVCQGTAFTDVYDFLPLRLLDEEEEEKERVARKISADGRMSVLSNWHDDGALGYYPIVSVFGGGIATLNAGPNFTFPPPPNIDALLSLTQTERNDAAAVPVKDTQVPQWRPLSERYEEFYAEQLTLDLVDEADAVRAYTVMAHSEATRTARGITGREKKSRNGNATSHSASLAALQREVAALGPTPLSLMANRPIGKMQNSRGGSSSGAATPLPVDEDVATTNAIGQQWLVEVQNGGGSRSGTEADADMDD